MRNGTNIYSIIMAGGGGTRFWPLSRQAMPKQLLNLSGKDVMINETIQRSSGLIDAADTFIVTNKNQVEALEKVLLESISRENILAEPVAKNTAPCLLYATMYVLENHGDGIVCVFPADHYITDGEKFLELLQNGIHEAVSEDVIVTIGVKPSYPSVGYGYIKIKEECTGNAYRVERFIEKPNHEKANEYIEDGRYYWNAGIFICKASVIVELYRRFLPKMAYEFEKIKRYLKMDIFRTVDGQASLKSAYTNIDSISIDYGIMERVDNAIMVKGDFGWNDIGSWDALGAVFPADDDGNVVKANHVGIDTRGCVIYGGERLVVTINAKDLIVVDTNDTLMICPRDKAQDVKKMIDELGKRGKYDLL